jgi:hypothetical protein
MKRPDQKLVNAAFDEDPRRAARFVADAAAMHMNARIAKLQDDLDLIRFKKEAKQITKESKKHG